MWVELLLEEAAKLVSPDAGVLENPVEGAGPHIAVVKWH
jgi:hypothetical protein